MPGQFQGEELMPRVKQTNFDSAVEKHTMSALQTGVAAGILWLWENPLEEMPSSAQITELSTDIAKILWSNMSLAGQPSLTKALSKITDVPLSPITGEDLND